VPDDVKEIYRQSRIVRAHLDGPNLDQIAQVLLQPRLDGKLHSGCKLNIVGRENQLHDAASEIRPIHALARSREKDLPDHAADVVVIGVERGTSARIEAKWKPDVHTATVSAPRFTTSRPLISILGATILIPSGLITIIDAPLWIMMPVVSMPGARGVSLTAILF